MAFLKNVNFKYLIAFSLAIFALQVIYCYFIGFLNFLMFKVLFIPAAIVFSAYILFKKSKFAKTFLFIVLIAQSLLVSGGLISLNYLQTHNNWHYQENISPTNYENAKKLIYCKKCIRHFPKSISNGIKDVEFYQYNNYFKGSEGIFLKFKTNSNYIKKEIKNYKYLNIEGLSDKENKYSYCLKNSIRFKNNFLDIKGYKFYVIKNKKPFFQHFQMEYGLAVKGNTILYYYTKPD